MSENDELGKLGEGGSDIEKEGGKDRVLFAGTELIPVGQPGAARFLKGLSPDGYPEWKLEAVDAIQLRHRRREDTARQRFSFELPDEAQSVQISVEIGKTPKVSYCTDQDFDPAKAIEFPYPEA